MRTGRFVIILSVVVLFAVSGMIGYSHLSVEKESALELSNMEALTEDENERPGLQCFMTVLPASPFETGYWVFECIPCNYMVWAELARDPDRCGQNW